MVYECSSPINVTSNAKRIEKFVTQRYTKKCEVKRERKKEVEFK